MGLLSKHGKPTLPWRMTMASHAHHLPTQICSFFGSNTSMTPEDSSQGYASMTLAAIESRGFSS